MPNKPQTFQQIMDWIRKGFNAKNEEDWAHLHNVFPMLSYHQKELLLGKINTLNDFKN